jgi:hydrogenase expression/formation protein HypD
MEALLQAEQWNNDKGVNLDGFVGPAHVSIIIGSDAYKRVALQYQKPIVISGFEPLDVMHSILILIHMINEGKYGIENQYTRAVIPEGNKKSQQIIAETLELREEFEWRGLGFIPQSAMKINKNYSEFDAEIRFPLFIPEGQEHKACECGAILRGVKKPTDCKLFAKACTPENPLGSCMVSSEGACAAYYTYGRLDMHKFLRNQNESVTT